MEKLSSRGINFMEVTVAEAPMQQGDNYFNSIDYDFFFKLSVI